MDPLDFVQRHGVVLASGKGPVPSVAEAVAGEPIKGSWWGHPKGKEIFDALSLIDDSPEVLSFRLVQGKITFVHRKVWPALVRLADVLGLDALTALKQEHTASGAHRTVKTPYPKWVPKDVERLAERLTQTEAEAQCAAWLKPKKASGAKR